MIDNNIDLTTVFAAVATLLLLFTGFLGFIRSTGSKKPREMVVVKHTFKDRFRVPGPLFKGPSIEILPEHSRLEEVQQDNESLKPALNRLEEVQQEYSRQRASVKTYKWMNGFLTIGQYIIGGLLASSFIQQSLSPHMVGFLGLLVLLSSLIYQHFRPDLKLRGAVERSAILHSAILDAEDDLYEMKINSPKAISIEDFRRTMSAVLSVVAASEWQDLTTHTIGEVQTGSTNNKPANSANEDLPRKPQSG